MTIPLHNVPPADPLWEELEKTCRRISFLRAVGRRADAERVQATDLAAAAAAVHQKAENIIREVQAIEQKRADQAVAFAEHLAPTLAQHVRDSNCL